MNCAKGKQCRIVVFPLPFQGHINPMLQLASILHSRGFLISVVHTLYNSPDPSKHPHFAFHPISDGLSESPDSAPDPVRIIKLINLNCLQPFRQCLHALLSHGDVKCLISDANWYFTSSVVDALSLPRIVMRTSSVGAFLAFAALSLLRAKGYLLDRDSKMEEPVEEVPPLKVKDMPAIEMYDAEDAYKNIAKMVEETKKASALIFNTFEEFELPEIRRLHEQFASPTFAIPFHKCFSAASSSLLAQDRSSISWLDNQPPKSVLYVSFGSVAAMDTGKLREVAWGLADSGHRFLWAVRPGLVHSSEWLEMLPSGFSEATSGRGIIIKWAPQQEVLSHPSVGGFWTHNGWNSTLESICEGVPMICSPFFGDQLVNARYVSDVWRVGINLEGGLERGGIQEAITKLMDEKEGEEMRKRAMMMKEKIDVGLKMGGSSCSALDELIDFISSFQRVAG
ncbi:LOW QUALITY PROTEIN: UDP-glycosyltransferase 76B1-like [Salvia miltiorrhiza]|uniref:LOW QUALITY PROTEIN: UDP-glycosyltransferase 76B1-like n=1 Tax=Salvia miltiorrhiza TaxID=226208 RepID=UPI0025AC6A2E|nr:LOW QUALITY PROTEIN: UDP-glycosyltransferase 76B1-like [Salvia miltiorrhiza]